MMEASERHPFSATQTPCLQCAPSSCSCPRTSALAWGASGRLPSFWCRVSDCQQGYEGRGWTPCLQHSVPPTAPYVHLHLDPSSLKHGRPDAPLQCGMAASSRPRSWGA